MKIKDVFKKLCNFLCILFFIALFIGLAGNISSKFDKVYDLIKFKSYVILSDSMKPAMDPGDVIFIKKINVDNLKAGDIITFQKEEFIATHRIIKFEDKSIITQGDNNNLADDPLTKENVIGKYMFKVPKIGYFYSFVWSPIGIIVISTIIVIIIIYEIYFVDDKKEKKNNKKLR